MRANLYSFFNIEHYEAKIIVKLNILQKMSHSWSFECRFWLFDVDYDTISIITL